MGEEELYALGFEVLDITREIERRGREIEDERGGKAKGDNQNIRERGRPWDSRRWEMALTWTEQSPSVGIRSRLAYSMQSAIKVGIMWGPFSEEEMHWAEYKVSPLTVGLKPNGSARIIMNLSWPLDAKLGDGTVVSVNEGMSQWEAFEDCRMANVRVWRVFTQS